MEHNEIENLTDKLRLLGIIPQISSETENFSDKFFLDLQKPLIWKNFPTVPLRMKQLSTSKNENIMMCDDVIYEIILFSNITDFKHLGLVCKTWTKIVYSLSKIKYSFVTRSKVHDHIITFLKKCKNLKHLNLSECINLTDSGIENIGHLQRLKSLNLSGCSKITETAIMHISKCLKLKHLNLAMCFGIKSTGFLNLSKLKNLKFLNLIGCKLLDLSLNFLEHVHLISVDLYCFKITWQGLRFLKNNENLKKISLYQCPILDNTFIKHLGPNINELIINGGNNKFINDDAFKYIHKFKLVKLSIVLLKNITNESLRYISQISTLEYFKISECTQITHLGIRYFLKNCKKIKNFVLFNKYNIPQMTDDEIKIIHDCVTSGRIISVDLWNCFGISEAGRQILNKIPKINQGWRCEPPEEKMNEKIFKKRRALENILSIFPNYLKQHEVTMSDNYVSIVKIYRSVKEWFNKNNGTVEDYEAQIDKLTDIVN